MARKFLYIVAALVVLVFAGLLAMRIWSDDLTEMAFIPKARFTEQPALDGNAYAAMDMWIARPA